MPELPSREPRRYNNELPADEPPLLEEPVTKLALAIGAVIREHGAIRRFREMVLFWWEEWRACRKQQIEFGRRCAEYAEMLLTTPRLCDETAPRDENRWRFETMELDRTADGHRRPPIAGWVPFELWWENGVEAGSPLPVPDCEVTLAEKYAALSAIYDGASKGTEKVAPFDHDTLAGAEYSSLIDEIWRLPESDEQHLRAWLAVVEDDIALVKKSPTPKADIPGVPAPDRESSPPPATRLAPSREAALAAYDWAMSKIPGADKMTRSELYEAICIHPEMTSEFLDKLPDRPDTFGRYLREAGIKRYNSKGDRAHRISHFPRKSES